MQVLISGAGIAGPTLAYWLAHYGWKPTIVERAPRLRIGGYVIDFWGAGLDIADRMGLMLELERKGYKVREVRIVDRNGKKISGFGTEVVTRATRGRIISIARGDLAASIFGKIEGRVEIIFGDSIAGIEQTRQSVRVTFENARAREFDLVVGADGLHSKVRELVFGAEKEFEKYLGYKVAAFQVEGYKPRDELVYVSYSQPGQQVARFALNHDRTMFFFTFTDDGADSADDGDIQAQKSLLRRRFGNSGWECPQILDALDACNDLYFDRVSQIRMDPRQGLWARGRVTLIGDAAFCVSLLAGEGAGLAMVAAYILAGELRDAGEDYATAFARYQELLGPFVLGKQNAACRFAGAFAPKSPLALFMRNQIVKLLRFRWVADLTFGELTDKIAVPDY